MKKQKDINDKFAGINKNPSGIIKSNDGIYYFHFNKYGKSLFNDSSKSLFKKNSAYLFCEFL